MSERILRSAAALVIVACAAATAWAHDSVRDRAIGEAFDGTLPPVVLAAAGGKNAGKGESSIAKQCQRNADHYHLTGLQRQAHIEKCMKDLSVFSNQKKNGQP